MSPRLNSETWPISASAANCVSFRPVKRSTACKIGSVISTMISSLFENGQAVVSQVAVRFSHISALATLDNAKTDNDPITLLYAKLQTNKSPGYRTNYWESLDPVFDGSPEFTAGRAHSTQHLGRWWYGRRPTTAIQSKILRYALHNKYKLHFAHKNLLLCEEKLLIADLWAFCQNYLWTVFCKLSSARRLKIGDFYYAKSSFCRSELRRISQLYIIITNTIAILQALY